MRGSKAKKLRRIARRVSKNRPWCSYMKKMYYRAAFNPLTGEQKVIDCPQFILENGCGKALYKEMKRNA